MSHLSSLRRGVHHSKHMQRAFNKYGEKTFVFEVLEFCENDKLLEIEQKYLDSLKPEYNACKVAGSCLGVKLGPFSEEHRRKIGEAHKGKKLSKEHCEMIGNFHRGKKISESHKARLSECNSGENNAFYGKKHTPETIEKVSGYNHHSSLSVICVETGMAFGSSMAARAWLRENGKPSAQCGPILDCCRGSTRYSRVYGYKWRFAANEDEFDCRQLKLMI